MQKGTMGGAGADQYSGARKPPALHAAPPPPTGRRLPIPPINRKWAAGFGLVIAAQAAAVLLAPSLVAKRPARFWTWLAYASFMAAAGAVVLVGYGIALPEQARDAAPLARAPGRRVAGGRAPGCRVAHGRCMAAAWPPHGRRMAAASHAAWRPHGVRDGACAPRHAQRLPPW
jgi:hypothetical protein